jgi:hypothetical protein
MPKPKTPHFNLTVPGKYVEVDMTHIATPLLAGRYGRSGLPKPETLDFKGDSERLARYTDLFHKAEEAHPVFDKKLDLADLLAPADPTLREALELAVSAL